MTSKEALEFLKSCGTNTEEPYESKIIEALEKLVERDTPKKVKNKQHGVCPNCDQNFSFMHINYCFECGQRLDWSE